MNRIYMKLHEKYSDIYRYESNSSHYLRYFPFFNARQKLSVICRLFFIMGLNWYIEIIISLFYDISYDGWISFCIDQPAMIGRVFPQKKSLVLQNIRIMCSRKEKMYRKSDKNTNGLSSLLENKARERSSVSKKFYLHIFLTQ